jgi:hypothetical protein
MVLLLLLAVILRPLQFKRTLDEYMSIQPLKPFPRFSGFPVRLFERV